MDRKIELERKKAKLQAIRDEKRRKEEEKKRAAADSPKPDAPAGDLRRQTEDLLKDLGIPTESPPAAAASPAAAAAPAAGGEAAAAAPVSSLAKKKVMLTTSKVTQTNIPPRENVSYSKETQTPAQQIDKEVARHWDYYACSTTSNSPSLGNSPFHQRGYGRCDSATHHLEWDDEFMFPDAVKRRKDDDNDSLDVVGGVGVGTDPSGAAGHPHPPGAGHGRMPQAEPPKPADTPADAIASPKEEEKPVPVRELTEEEKQAAQMTEEFQRFFDRATRVVERALYEKVNLLTDYAGTDDDDQEGGLQEGEKLKLNRQFFDERWSKHRTVTCMDWSTQHPELLVASYNNNEESPHEPDGVTLIWNIKYKKTTPEYIFHCQSAVMSTCFAKFHPNLLIGGTYSGQIVLWDNRSNKRTPVQRTPLSASAHTHPVYCVNVVGTQNAHNLISVSTDGKMCSWSLDMLSQPQDSIELQNKQAKPVAVTTMSFLSGDVNNFVVGSEEGVVYTACRHGSKAGVNDMFEGHMGPVTGIDCNTVPGAIDFSQYFITSSFDWTVKLWNIKENRALHSFEDNSEYVYAARWSPIHPALFATVDGAGRLDMWNLNNDTEVPTASTVVEGNVALNKALWHQSGQHIAVGDDLGKIHIYDVGENLAQPRSDEWQRFVNTLQDLKSEQAEHDDDLSKPLR